ncbi:hypothetical protein [Poseidonibacter antarcticus]|uniref:hypothetical protein n=1 Tax=Poseidonibacter antarcticus TaxID=2478538 RepID=UPI000EF535B4|nr:hypothetical protein [Poseidonibacter antarcticus]
MKVLISIIILINFSFASNANVSLMNNIKSIIQKEEYIALAINKYILQKAKVPKTGTSLNWNLLENDDYLGTDFDKINPLTNEDIVVTFDTDNNAYIKSILTNIDEYDNKSKYLYNFYINKIFRVNTIPPKNNTGDELIIGSQVLYNDIQKEIVEVLNETDTDKKRDILFPNQDCTTDITTSTKEYYELKNEKLTLKYCKLSKDLSEDLSFDIYQNGPVYLDEEYDENDLQEIIANIGDIAYVDSVEYIYQSGDDEENRWVEISKKVEYGEEEYTQEQVQNYIPNASDLVMRKDFGCKLANGDIYCWEKNTNKRAGVEDESIYLNTPIMLKVDDGNLQYNSSQRVKFIKIALNDTNVCGISTDGDMYCNGNVSNTNFDIDISDKTSILRKYKNISSLKDIAMVNDAWVLLNDLGTIYTLDSNASNAQASDKTFKKIYALRDSKTFGALDSDNYFNIWGERESGNIATPTEVSSIKFDEDRIFVNSKEFTLKGLDGNYYRTNDNGILDLNIPNSSSVLSVSYYDYNGNGYILYINEKMQLQVKGTNTLLECKDKNFNACDSSSNTIFNTALNELNIIKDDKIYAKFSNVSIFSSGKINKDDEINSYFDVNGIYLEDFEDVNDYQKVDGKYNDWVVNTNYLSSNTLDSDIPIYENKDCTEKYSCGLLGLGTCTRPIACKEAGNFLGRFGDTDIFRENNPFVSNDNTANPVVSKIFNFGSSYAGKKVKLTFDFYRIDIWTGDGDISDTLGEALTGLLDGLIGNLLGLGSLLNAVYDLVNGLLELVGLIDIDDIFIPFVNDLPVKDGTLTDDENYYWWYVHNQNRANTGYSSLQSISDSKDLTNIKNTKSLSSSKDYSFSFKEKEFELDSEGKIKLGFEAIIQTYVTLLAGSRVNDIENVSWGIDNIKIELVDKDSISSPPPYVCTMTGIETSTQMYCWGNVARAIPILNTSLYDVSKIDNIGDINDLFISQVEDEAKQMSFDNYNNNGNLFLKYPTYIGGFDYGFYFK